MAEPWADDTRAAPCGDTLPYRQELAGRPKPYRLRSLGGDESRTGRLSAVQVIAGAQLLVLSPAFAAFSSFLSTEVSLSPVLLNPPQSCRNRGGGGNAVPPPGWQPMRLRRGMSTMNISLAATLKASVDAQVTERGYGTSSQHVESSSFRARNNCTCGDCPWLVPGLPQAPRPTRPTPGPARATA
jgi:hypothetical protein